MRVGHRRSNAGHAKGNDLAAAADHCDGLLDLRSVLVGEVVKVGADAADQPPYTSDFLVGRHRLVPGPGVGAERGEPFPTAQQIGEARRGHPLDRLAQPSRRGVQIGPRRARTALPQQRLHLVQNPAGVGDVTGKGMAQHARNDAALQASPAYQRGNHLADRIRRHRRPQRRDDVQMRTFHVSSSPITSAVAFP
ncbi:hypothetical protein [Streptomyces sp. NPDC047043]|uniref:hypothetical protein n=1 Tax=Streptomyces sp. NPDC047043 TaxID=3154497 RepID=UPI0033C93FF3